jgi:hypothetical protein
LRKSIVHHDNAANIVNYILDKALRQKKGWCVFEWIIFHFKYYEKTRYGTCWKKIIAGYI